MKNKQPSTSLTTIETFKKYFSIEVANTEETKYKVYQIRYRVYCKEFEYESIADCPNEMEIDEYDDGSTHCLIIHKATQLPAACVRLIPTNAQDKQILLPFEKYCAESLDSDLINQLALKREMICEISRLAVDGRFRKRSGEALNRFGGINLDFSKEERRTFLLIAVAGFLTATALTHLSGRTNVFAMMEPFLPRLLKRSGIIFQKVGLDIDYHGVRAPYFTDTQLLPDSMRPELIDLYHWIYKQIKPYYQ